MPRRSIALLLFALLLPWVGGAGAVTVTLHEANNTTSGSGYYVSGVQNISQSFTAASSYTMSRVALDVYDIGADDSLNVYLVADAGGIPSNNPSSILAQGSNNTLPSANWYFFDLSPHVRLVSGTVYWIVARNNEPTNADGYVWVRSSANSYAGGTMAYDLGSGWTRLNEDMTFRNYGYADANIVVAVAANRTMAPPGSAIRYTIYANNTGPENAGRAWVNVTLPGELSYTSDDASANGWTLLGNNSWTMGNVTPGIHSFHINTVLRSGVGGQIITVRATADFRGVLGSVGSGTQASRDIIVQAPRIDLRALATPPYVRRTDNVTFRVYFNNTGNAVARWLWINCTLPAFSTYLTDDASALRSLTPGYLNLTFSNVAVGTHAFNLTLSQMANLPAGADFVLNVTADYRDNQGTSYPRSYAGAMAVLRAPHITLTLAADKGYLTPGDRVALTLDYGDTGPGITLAQNLYLNLTLPVGLGFVNAIAGYNTSLAPQGFLSWYLPTLLVGASGRLGANASVAWPLSDGSPLPLMALAKFQDDLGIPMPQVYSNLTLGARVPFLAPSATLNRSEVEAGGILDYTVQFNNSGRGTASRVWINATFSPGLAFSGFQINMTSGLLVNFHPSLRELDFVFANVAQGPQFLLIQATPVGALANGTVLSITTAVGYTDANGNPTGSLVLPSRSATVRAPVLRGSITLSQASASAGQVVQFTLGVQNRGLAAAKDYWVNLTLDSSLTPLADDAGVPREDIGPRVSWHFLGLQPGDSRQFAMTVQVASSLPQDRLLEFVLSTAYTDAQGTPLGEDRTPTVGLLLPATVKTPLSPMDLAQLGAVVAALVITLFLLVQRFREPAIEEVLLVHREGLLMASASRGAIHGKDRDILAGSLVAVQDFIKEAFAEEAQKELDRLDLGNYKIIIRRGKGVFLVMALRGNPTHRTMAVAKETLKTLEDAYGRVLEEWDGNLEQIAGVKIFLAHLLETTKGRRARREE